MSQSEGCRQSFFYPGRVIFGVLLCAFFSVLTSTIVLAQNVTPPTSEIVGTLPKGHFLENLTAGPNGDLFITDYVGRAIIRYQSDDGLRLIRVLGVHPVGIERAETGFVVSAHVGSIMNGPSQIGANLILEVTDKGKVTDQFEVPGAIFLNGVEHLTGSQFLVADSIRGVIFLVDTVENSVRIWLDDPRLAPADPPTPAPAANGIKIRDGVVYISNSARGSLLTVPVDDPRPETVSVLLENTVIDDFVFSEEGTIFATTHSKDVLRITPDLKVSVFANEAQGVAGGTAAEIVKEGGRTFLYIIGDGGLFEGLTLKAPSIVRILLSE
ncbi:hypothetical protein [uncultured Roseobacter sp.]|uniref:hypothetical protein n=1 Tax=uncultured Roseobacter sp. TaxID=114847 RepID=UPI002617614B|nr:hypothetical protein [uncultured Roseobacter sp.]